jgi:multiple sugar transport system permease protein
MSKDTLFFRASRAVVLVGLSLFVLFPLVIAFTTASTPYEDLSTTFRWIPERPTLSAFVDVWSDMPLARYFVNSAIVTAGTVLIAIPIALAAAYAVSR